MMYTKELVFSEFNAEKEKDLKLSKKTEVYTNRIKYLQDLKVSMIKTPKIFDQFNVTPDQLQNTIDCYLSPNPTDAFYLKVFGKTYAEQKAYEEEQDQKPKVDEKEKNRYAIN